MPAAFSISPSRSTNGMPSRAAASAPTVLLPAPGMPTSARPVTARRSARSASRARSAGTGRPVKRSHARTA